MAERPLITLLSDFGFADAYAAAMKGVILSICPDAALIDVSHDVRPQGVLQAVYLAGAAWPYFPRHTVHVAVVDPGAGTERRALVLETPRGRFVGPDNGVLSAAIEDAARPPREAGLSPVPLPAGCRACALATPAGASATFHGRDVFAPAAARLASGASASELGEPVDTLLAFPPLRARRCADGSLEAQVLHIDRFGNVITDARAEDLPGGPFVVEIAGERVIGPVRTYAEAGGLAAIVGSSGFLEIALPGASAAAGLGIDIGDAVLVRPEG